VSDAPITRTTLPETKPGTELRTLAAVYRFILDCHAKKKAARPGGHGEAKGAKNDRPANPILPT
jgi:hypothetical protein